jgi:hypothetical protein
MQKEIPVFDRNEKVTILPARSPGTHRVTWRPSHGGPDERFEVRPSDGDTVEQAVTKELRKRSQK